MFAISWSRLERFEQCSLKSYWVDFAPKHLKIKQGTNPAFEKGKKYHLWMQKALQLNKELPDPVKPFQKIVTGIKKSPGKLIVEKQLALTEKYQVCDWFSPKAYWRTIFDAAIIDKNSVSVDWKTGKIKDVASDQLKFSAAAAMLAWPEIQHINNYYVWLDHPDAPPTSYSVSKKQLPAVMEEFEERVELVKICHEEEAWEPQPSPLACKFCPCTKAHCKYAEE